MKKLMTIAAAAAGAMVASTAVLADAKFGLRLSLEGPGSGVGIPMQNPIEPWPQTMQLAASPAGVPLGQDGWMFRLPQGSDVVAQAAARQLAGDARVIDTYLGRHVGQEQDE